MINQRKIEMEKITKQKKMKGNKKMKVMDFIKNIWENIKNIFQKGESVKSLNEGNTNNITKNVSFKTELIVPEEKYIEIERKIKSKEIILNNLSVEELKEILKIYEDAIKQKKENISELMRVHKNLINNNI